MVQGVYFTGVKRKLPSLRKKVRKEEEVVRPLNDFEAAGVRVEPSLPTNRAPEDKLASYIVFDCPPTVEECLRSGAVPNPATARQRWRSFSTRINAPEPEPASPEHQPDDDATDEPEVDSFVDRSDVYRGALRFGDDDESVSVHVGHEQDESQGQPGSILDPPTQSQRVRSFYPYPAQISPQQHQGSVDDSYANWNVGEDTEFSLIGAPPRFPWDPSSTRPLVAMHNILLHAGAKSTRVSLLACVIDVRMPTGIASGKTRAEWDLADSSGALISLTLWGDTATAWCGVIRRGDVVFLGDVTLSKYRAKLQITAQDHHSALQICYRTHVASEADEVYVFRDEHSDFSGAAKKVLEQVYWFAKAYPSRR